MALLRASALSLSAASPALQQPQGGAGGGGSGRNSGGRLVSTAAAATTSSSGRGGAALSASVPAAAWYVKKGDNGSQLRSAGICCVQNRDVMQVWLPPGSVLCVVEFEVPLCPVCLHALSDGVWCVTSYELVCGRVCLRGTGAVLL